MNYTRTAILLAGLTALFMAVGYLLGGPEGMVIAFIVAVGMNVFSYWRSDKLVLSMYRAQEVDDRTAPEFVGLVRELSTRAGLPMPRTYLMDNPQPNVFATGRNPQHAAVCATTGLLDMLSPRELAGVIGHELTHVKNRDTLTMTVTATIAGAISMLAQFGMFFGGGRRGSGNRGGGLAALLAIFLAPLAAMLAMLVQMAISRTREYAADRGSAQLSGDPWTRLGTRQDRHRSPPDRERPRPTEPGDGTALYHQPAVGGPHGQSVRHPSLDSEPHRRSRGACGSTSGLTAALLAQ